uniref:Uncharacterized protein n=1 Tax=Mucochytrium quahogii TaxID=96639 RepID=A0A7S2R8Y6_9STRA|mmetsp:Transcript_8106/g.13049  ORF Transcript_8106/g.13049 Transcript_8106/m.13049 type:complete len:413 (-) Transcript_8106:1191-2429(-)|eukprot:CAMPEP_0203784304 /NCGR_PEP_ID=MMETSP0100_2-20121128/390_1 /ASSEMBLY_ACC=CAM_ASM_000210 /TAXON_ID=96639 /ORGANISM=" , Strain NY0313808BC1" /LENGTH=412 /DNA_ID=CAMNT_0050686267 /DNA_START=413 /DNA_END=1651 /DNA_ORIENTATION=+
MSCSPEVNALKAQNLIKNESDQAVGKLIHMESEQKLETPESEQNLFSSETEEQLVQATAAAVSKSVKLRAFIDELDARTIVELTLSMKVHASSVSENQAKDVLREILVFAMAESIKLMNRSQALETLFAVLGHEKESLIICLMDGDEQLVDAAPGTYLRTRYIRARAKSLKVRETSNISSETNEQVVKDKVEGPCEDDVIRTVRSREHGSSGFCVPEETPHDTDSCDGSSVTSSETSSECSSSRSSRHKSHHHRHRHDHHYRHHHRHGHRNHHNSVQTPHHYHHYRSHHHRKYRKKCAAKKKSGGVLASMSRFLNKFSLDEICRKFKKKEKEPKIDSILKTSKGCSYNKKKAESYGCPGKKSVSFGVCTVINGSGKCIGSKPVIIVEAPPQVPEEANLGVSATIKEETVVSE